MRTPLVGLWLGIVGLFGLVAAQAVGEFLLKVVELRGSVEARLPDGTERVVKEEEKLPPGSIVKTQAESVVILEWLPYKARVKLAPETEVQPLATRALSLRRGRIWVGTPPPPMWGRRFPLPLQCNRINIVSSPDAFFSVAQQTDGKVIISVDQGSVFVSVGQDVVLVPKGKMVVVTPQNLIVGPMPLTKQEQLLWDMGGPR